MTEERLSSKVAELSNFVWGVAETLRGHYRAADYGKFVLPFVVLRRLDCVLEASKDAVLEAAAELPAEMDEEIRAAILHDASGLEIAAYNVSKFTFAKLKGQDPEQLHENLVDFITGFDPLLRDVFFRRFKIAGKLEELLEKDLLYPVFEDFCGIDLHPDTVSNLEMGYLFEDLIRKFSEASNEDAGDHYTPREVVKLIVSLLLESDRDALFGKGKIRRWYDPTCGTGGILSVGEAVCKEYNPDMTVELFGQQLSDEGYAICLTDMLLKGQDPSNIKLGNTLTNDLHAGEHFRYIAANPPYGVDWKAEKKIVEAEHENLGFQGRFGAGLPPTSDGSLLFVQHMISKMRDDPEGSRVGVVLNGSPLFSGGAGSGPSEIRRWILEQDLLEAIVALPTEMFYNTGIATYIWVINNRKPDERAGQVQLINATGEAFWSSMRKSLGMKRRFMTEDQLNEVLRLFADWSIDSPHGKIFPTTTFGYRRVKIQRPLRLAFAPHDKTRRAALAEDKAWSKLSGSDQGEILAALDNLPEQMTSRSAFLKGLKALKLKKPLQNLLIKHLGESDPEAELCLDAAKQPEADSSLTDYEQVPLDEDIETYFQREVIPHVPDAWIDQSYRDSKDQGIGVVGFEINFNRYFYQYVAPRPLEAIDADLKAVEAEIEALLAEVTE